MGGDLYDSKKPGGSKQVADPLFDEEDYEPFEAIPPLNQPQALVRPEDLTLKHRIGRGPFGDVWLATIHSHREEFDEFHEVAVKMLPAISEDHIRGFTSKLEKIFSLSQGASSVTWPRGLTMKNGKACVITKFFELSIGDKMARLPGNCIALADALRYGVNLSQGVLDLHSRGITALNLKPFNFLLDEHDQAVLGEFGIPFLLMDAISADGPLVWLGTPNYMAPEQWEPKLRGPVSYETDSWGFACSFIEMLTGVKPWNTMSPTEIFHAVVVKGDKPVIPSGLPIALTRMLTSCLASDRRDRPSFTEILSVLQSPNVLLKEADWVIVSDKSFKQGSKIGVVKKMKGLESVLIKFCDKPEEPVEYTGLLKCSPWRDAFQIGDVVKLNPSVPVPRFSWNQQQADAEGSVIEVDKDNAVFLVKFQDSGETFKADPAEIQLVCGGIIAGDWVRVREGWSSEGSGRSPSNVGIAHKILTNGLVRAAFQGLETLWEGPPNKLVKTSPFQAGQYVRLKNEVVEPRFEWPMKNSHVWETGKISRVLPNGSLLVDFPGRLWNRKCHWADAEEVEIVRLNDCNGIVEKYEHLQAMHWAIGPALCLLGFLAAAKVGGLVIRPFRGGGGGGGGDGGERKKSTEGSSSPPSSSLAAADAERQITQYMGDSKGNPLWLPPAVASYLFKEGGNSS